MSVVALRKKGLIYETTFTEINLDSRWELTPADPSRVSLSGGNLQLKHGGQPLYMFFSPLSNEKQFVIDVKNSYNPTTDGDYGGLIVYGNTTDIIHIEEYFDTVTGTATVYPWVRLVRDYNNYTAYWSEDGIAWTLIGTETFDNLSPKVGLFIEGDSGADLIVEEVRIYTTTKITVDNLTPGATVYLKDQSGNTLDSKVCITGSSKIAFDVAAIPLPLQGKIEILNGATLFSSDSTVTLWGGDQYSFEINVDLYFVSDSGGTSTEIHLNSQMEEFLGYLNSDTTFRDYPLVVRNRHLKTFTNIKISLIQHKGTDDYLRLIELAPSAGGTFTNQVVISSLAPGTETNIWMRLKRETDPNRYTTEVFFGLNVASVYNY